MRTGSDYLKSLKDRSDVTIIHRRRAVRDAVNSSRLCECGAVGREALRRHVGSRQCDTMTYRGRGRAASATTTSGCCLATARTSTRATACTSPGRRCPGACSAVPPTTSPGWITGMACAPEKVDRAWRRLCQANVESYYGRARERPVRHLRDRAAGEREERGFGRRDQADLAADLEMGRRRRAAGRLAKRTTASWSPASRFLQPARTRRTRSCSEISRRWRRAMSASPRLCAACRTRPARR